MAIDATKFKLLANIIVTVYAPARMKENHARKVIVVSDVALLVCIVLAAATDFPIFKILFWVSIAMRLIQMVVAYFWSWVCDQCRTEIKELLQDTPSDTVHKY